MTKAQLYAQQERERYEWSQSLKVGSQVTCKSLHYTSNRPRGVLMELTGEIISETNDTWEISFGMSETFFFAKKQGLPVVKPEFCTLGRINPVK